MSSVVSLPNHTFTGQAYSSKWLISIVHIFSPESWTWTCYFQHLKSIKEMYLLQKERICSKEQILSF